MKKAVLVTGAAGFIGSHLSHRLLQAGFPVVGMDNFDNYYSPEIKRQKIDLLEKYSRFHLIEGDIRDTELLARTFSQNDFGCVMHLAARAGVRPSVENPLLYQDVNIKGTVSLLQVGSQARISKFVFASSSSVYGINEADHFREDAVINHPVSPYAASKAACELFCSTYNHLYRLPVIALRLFTVYGPGQRPDLAIYRFTRQILNDEEITVFGNGSTYRDYTYIDDIVDGFLAAMNYPGDSFQIFNLGGGRTVSLKELIEIIEKALDKKSHARYADPFPGDVPATSADITKAKNLLGYVPKFNIEEGVRQFVRWYRKSQQAANSPAGVPASAFEREPKGALL